MAELSHAEEIREHASNLSIALYRDTLGLRIRESEQEEPDCVAIVLADARRFARWIGEGKLADG
jgi:hypothetical protein